MNITGIDDALRYLTFDFSAINDIVENTGKEILDGAKSKCDSPEIRASLDLVIVEDAYGITANVGSSDYKAPFLEFGTGVYVNILYGQEQYAMDFYVNGKGTMLPKAYLMPTYFEKRNELIERLKTYINGKR